MGPPNLGEQRTNKEQKEAPGNNLVHTTNPQVTLLITSPQNPENHQVPQVSQPKHNSTNPSPGNTQVVSKPSNPDKGHLGEVTFRGGAVTSPTPLSPPNPPPNPLPIPNHKQLLVQTKEKEITARSKNQN